MKRFHILLILLIVWQIPLQAQTYSTGCHHDQLRTLIIHPVNDWMAFPVLLMNSEDQLLISFDELSHDYKRYAYRIIHCDKDWKRSDLNELEYLEGFPDNDIETYERSNNTLTLYTHYSITIPNERAQLKVSGNYALEVYDKNGTGETLLTACFMLLENKVSIKASVTASTDIDFEQQHQQLRIEVNPLGWMFQQPESEIRLSIRQNRRTDNEVTTIEPSLINPSLLIYEHCKELIFEGGNEYRRFEITSYKHSGIGVNRVSFFKPFYNAELFEENARLGGYVYDQDQNGRYLIHNTDFEPDETESDYFLVHFSFPTAIPMLEGGLYLHGDLVENRLNANSKLLYNFEHKAYEKTLFLKQGSYNYQYLYRPTSGGKPSLLITEGSYWQTENEYQILVYYRPVGGRYDQLVGFSELKTSF